MLVQRFPGFAPSVLTSSFSAGSPRDVSDEESKFPTPGYPFCVAAGSGTTLEVRLASPPGMPAACRGSGINYLNPTAHAKTPCMEDLVRANVLPHLWGGFYKPQANP